MKKKVNVFGKGVPVFVIVLLGLAIVSAALLPYFGKITGLVTVSQGLLVDGLSVQTGSGNIQDSYDSFTSLQNPTYVLPHELENHASVQANGSITSDCSTLNTTNDCSDVDYRAVEYFDNAGANFSGYTTPSCTTTISGGIQTAIDAATTGDVICVDTGTYAEDVNINKDITLVAVNSPDSGSAAIITGDNSGQTGVINLAAQGATIKGFVVAPTSWNSAKKTGIYVTTGDTTLDSNIIKDITGIGSSIDGIYIISQSTSGISNILITNNLIQNLVNTGRGANGIMIQGNVDGVSVTYNTIKDISTTNTTVSWDYAMGIQDTPASAIPTISPKSLVIEYNTLDNIQSVIEPGRGFGVDEVDNHTNWADASQVTLKHNSFFNVPNDLTNKDHDHTLNAKDNYFDNLVVNANGNAKDETGTIDADWMTKTSFSITPNGVDKFATLASFPKMLYPDTYTVTTTVTV